MTLHRPHVLCLVAGLLASLACGGCVKQRTVTENGRVVSENLVVDRPVRDAIRESRD